MSGKGLLTGVIGGVAGFFIGGPAGAVIGFAAGMAIGSMVSAIDPDASDTAGSSQLDTLDITLAGYGDPLPDFVGTVKVAGNIIHNWGHRVVEITEQQSTPGAKGGGGEETQTVVVGYQHYLSWLLSFSYGPDPAEVLFSVLFNDAVVWYGELTDDDADGEETVQLGDTSGQNLGSMTFYFGTNNQIPNAKATAALEDSNYSSAYRGMVYACFDDVMIGSYAKAPSVKIVLGKWPEISAIGSASLAKINDIDYNPAHAIWYLSENHVGMPTALLDAVTFASTANYFKGTDYVGVSLLMNRQINAESYVEGIMTHVGASLVEVEGELQLGVLRDDVSVSSMETIDDDMVAEVPVLNVGSWEDTFNDLKVLYSKINHNFVVFQGEIKGEIDFYEYDTTQSLFQIIRHVMGNIYVIFYYSTNTVRTVEIATDGEITEPYIDTWNPAIGFSNMGDIKRAYLRSDHAIFVVYIQSSNNNRPELFTFKINDDGTIAKSIIDSQAISVNASQVGGTDLICHFSEAFGTFIVPYMHGVSGHVFLSSWGIDVLGNISAEIDSLQIWTRPTAAWSSNTFAIELHERGFGFQDEIVVQQYIRAPAGPSRYGIDLVTIGCSAAGTFTGVSDRLNIYLSPTGLPVGEGHFLRDIKGGFYGVASFYQITGGDERFGTYKIGSGGAITKMDEKLKFASHSNLHHVLGEGHVRAHAYSNSLEIQTMKISSLGIIGDDLDDLTLDTGLGLGANPYIVQISQQIFAVVYTGVSTDGYMKTFRVK